MKNLAKLTALTLTAALALTAWWQHRRQRRPRREHGGHRRDRGDRRRPVEQIQANGTITVAMEGTWALDLPRRERQPRRLRR